MRKIGFFLCGLLLCVFCGLRFYAADDLDIQLEKAYLMMVGGYDTVGYLRIPGTSISDLVVQGPDNTYYLRRDVQRAYSAEGSLFADFRCRFWGMGYGDAGSGTWEEPADGTSRNTVLYGNFPAGSQKLEEFQKFREPEFCERTPYIEFASFYGPQKWEVFSVMELAHTVPYNDPDPDPAAWQDLLRELRARSLCAYDHVTLLPDDHILTITAPIDAGGSTRFVVMARAPRSAYVLPARADEATWDDGPHYNPNTGR